MSHNIEQGMELLILKNPSFDKRYSRSLYYINFIKGVVTNVEFMYDKYDNESYKIYTVLGSDGNEYKGEYGDYSYLPDKYFFLTVADYQKSLKSIMNSKMEESNQIKLELNKFFDAYQRTLEVNKIKSKGQRK